MFGGVESSRYDAPSRIVARTSTSISRISLSEIEVENIVRKNAGSVTWAISCCRLTGFDVSAHCPHRPIRSTNSSDRTSATRARCLRPNIGSSIFLRSLDISPSSVGTERPIHRKSHWVVPNMLYRPEVSSMKAATSSGWLTTMRS
ncbi:Uncharacterised protein [Mycobacteroides abscessus subsp. abscessus]|nr:Uncharacterised protein [Mycobacteroides abscessus subsp. abscessus]